MAQVEADFRYEYQTELGTLLRRRFQWWLITWLIFWVITLLMAALSGTAPYWLRLFRVVGPDSIEVIDPRLIWILIGTLASAVVVGVTLWLGRRARDQADLLRLAFWVLVVNACIAVVAHYLSGDPMGGGFRGIAASHLLACLFLPWRPRQALQPAIPLLLIWLAGRFLFEEFDLSIGDTVTLWMRLMASVIMLMPGIAVCAFRISRFGEEFEARTLRRYFEDHSREMFDARRVHAELFPKPQLEGAIRFNYRDLPRAGIGGDFLHADFDDDGGLNLILLDVAGDSIGAALTVNRLHGELERFYAENPDVGPEQAAIALNRYTWLTLAPHGLYAAAMLFRILPDGSITWYGAGHAPAWIHRADGSWERLESSTWFLGATEEPDDSEHQHASRLHAGDVLIAHTDGLWEARDADNVPLQVAGSTKLIQTLAMDNPMALPDHFVEALATYQRGSLAGRPDTLVVAVHVHPASHKSDDQPDSQPDT